MGTIYRKPAKRGTSGHSYCGGHDTFITWRLRASQKDRPNPKPKPNHLTSKQSPKSFLLDVIKIWLTQQISFKTLPFNKKTNQKVIEALL